MNTKQTAFPHIPDGLLSELNRRFPERCAELTMETKEIWYQAGQRSVIRLLTQISIEQRDIELRSNL